MYQVYVVDDDSLILNEIINTIPWLDNGFEVAGCSDNPLVAIEEIKKIAPHVVFSDLRMPVMDGNEMIRTLKKQDGYCEYVMLSAFEDFKGSRTFYRQKGFDYITKPIQMEEVQMVLERLSERLAQTIGPWYIAEGMSQAFAELVTYLTAHFTQKHTLADLSLRFQLSKTYICNLFAKQYNSTFTRFVTDLRMQEAVRLMHDKTLTLAEIAIECGYADYYYFCRVFKEKKGMSPTKYRRANIHP